MAVTEEEEIPEEKTMADVSTDLPGMARKYKRYLEKLKEGKASGITSEFGKASDILSDQFLEPELILEDRENKTTAPTNTGTRELKPGDSLFSDESARKVFSDKFKEALKAMKAISTDEDDLASVQDKDAPALTHPPHQDMVVTEVETPAGVETEETEREAVEEAEAEAEPQLVTIDVDAETGEWLWSAVLLADSHIVRYVRFADGSTILPAMTGNYLVHVYPSETNDDPAVEVLGSAVIDIFTGNIYYRDASDTHAVAFLNNGWRLDQFVNEAGEEEDYALAPANAGDAAANRIAMRVNDLNLDVESGKVTFLDADTGTEFHLTSHRLSQDN